MDRNSPPLLARLGIAALSTIALLGTTAAPATAKAPEPIPDSPGREVVALARGEAIDMPDVGPQGVSASDGTLLVALDDYGNETPVVVQGDKLVAVADTVAVTPQGYAALRESGLASAKLVEPDSAAQVAELSSSAVASATRASACSGSVKWAAPAGGKYWKFTKYCGLIGVGRYAKKVYSWDVADGTACAKALGHAPRFNGSYWYYQDYWHGGGCATGYSAKTITVTWGEVLDYPRMQFRSASWTAGANGTFR